jgi:SAM-dependent methyltransferase
VAEQAEPGFDPAALVRARDLVDRFLVGRGERTAVAYTTDLEEFMRFAGAPSVPAAVARLLAGGHVVAQQSMLAYAVELRRWDRAPATIERRLTTLRALVRMAAELDLIDWPLELPSEAEVAAAVERGPVTDSAHYLFPRHPGEIDRLDIQHYALRATLGASYLAPIGTPARALDVGCGTGQWGFELTAQFPAALVVGIDLVAGKPDPPARYRFVRGNVMRGLPFADGAFDFVHQRLLVSGVPPAAYPTLVADLVRVTRPGGWVELVEVPIRLDGGGPATDSLLQLMRDLSAILGLDSMGTIHRSLDGYLRSSGLEAVARVDAGVPIGSWGGKVGSLMATDFRAGFTRVSEALQARGRMSTQTARSLIQEAQDECEAGRMTCPVAVAYGRRPA